MKSEIAEEEEVNFRGILFHENSQQEEGEFISEDNATSNALNLVIQILWHVDVFRRSFRAQAHHHICSKSGESCFYCLLKSVFTQFQNFGQQAIEVFKLSQTLEQSLKESKHKADFEGDDQVTCIEKNFMQIFSQLHQNTKFHDLNEITQRVFESCHSCCFIHKKFFTQLSMLIKCECGYETSQKLDNHCAFELSTNQLKLNLRGEMEVQNRANQISFSNILSVSKDGFLIPCPNCFKTKCKVTYVAEHLPNFILLKLDNFQQIFDHKEENLKELLKDFERGFDLNQLFTRKRVEDNEGDEVHFLNMAGMITISHGIFGAYIFHSKFKIWIHFDSSKVEKIGSDWDDVLDDVFSKGKSPVYFLYAKTGESDEYSNLNVSKGGECIENLKMKTNRPQMKTLSFLKKINKKKTKLEKNPPLHTNKLAKFISKSCENLANLSKSVSDHKSSPKKPNLLLRRKSFSVIKKIQSFSDLSCFFSKKQKSESFEVKDYSDDSLKNKCFKKVKEISYSNLYKNLSEEIMQCCDDDSQSSPGTKSNSITLFLDSNGKAKQHESSRKVKSVQSIKSVASKNAKDLKVGKDGVGILENSDVGQRSSAFPRVEDEEDSGILNNNSEQETISNLSSDCSQLSSLSSLEKLPQNLNFTQEFASQKRDKTLNDSSFVHKGDDWQSDFSNSSTQYQSSFLQEKSHFNEDKYRKAYERINEMCLLSLNLLKQTERTDNQNEAIVLCCEAITYARSAMSDSYAKPEQLTQARKLYNFAIFQLKQRHERMKFFQNNTRKSFKVLSRDNGRSEENFSSDPSPYATLPKNINAAKYLEDEPNYGSDRGPIIPQPVLKSSNSRKELGQKNSTNFIHELTQTINDSLTRFSHTSKDFPNNSENSQPSQNIQMRDNSFPTPSKYQFGNEKPFGKTPRYKSTHCANSQMNEKFKDIRNRERGETFCALMKAKSPKRKPILFNPHINIFARQNLFSQEPLLSSPSSFHNIQEMRF